MKRRRIRSNARQQVQPEGQAPGPESVDTALHREHEPDSGRQSAPADEEALSSDAGPAQDQQAVHEIRADEWLDAEAAVEPPVEPVQGPRGP